MSWPSSGTSGEVVAIETPLTVLGAHFESSVLMSTVVVVVFVVSPERTVTVVTILSPEIEIVSVTWVPIGVAAAT